MTGIDSVVPYVRVIAGSFKGRRLKAPTWDGLRPTSDKLRETLFNVLAPRIAGARVLDVYAGTGALGIEALSRGAAMVTFIEAGSPRAGADRREPRALRRREWLYYHPGERRARPQNLLEQSLVQAVRHRAARSAVCDREPCELASPHAAGRRAGRRQACVVLEHARRTAGAGCARAGWFARAIVVSGDSALTFYAHVQPDLPLCPPSPSIPARSIR